MLLPQLQILEQIGSGVEGDEGSGGGSLVMEEFSLESEHAIC